MNMVNKKYDIQLEVLTPLSIGAGSEKDFIKGVDFIAKGESIYLLNLKKMISLGVSIESLSTFFANKNDVKIAEILGNRLESVSDAVFVKPASTTNDIKSFIKNELTGKPIIPGSSLKGAIRSILFKYLRINESKQDDVFGKANTGDEFMRFIKLSDFSFDKTILSNTKIYNLKRVGSNWEGGWKHSFKGNNSTTYNFRQEGFNTIYEVLPPSAKGYGSIMLAETTFNNFGIQRQKYGKEKAEILVLSNLFEIINKHTEDYLNKELLFFEKYPAERSEEIIDNIKYLLSLIPADNSYCILKMSAGSGFHSITGDWQFDDYSINGLDTTKKVSRGLFNGEKSTKSRKISIIKNDKLSLMGFVKIRQFTEEEKQNLEAEAEKKRNEEKQIKEEARIKKEKQIELEKKYNELISTAEAQYEKKQLNEAIIIFRKAGDLIPNKNKPVEFINKIEKELKKIQQAKQEELAARQAVEEAAKKRKQQIKMGLSFLEEKYEDGCYKVTDFKGARNRIELWMKRANHVVLPVEEHDILIISLIRIYQNITKDRDKREWNTFGNGVWVSIVKWIGEEDARALYDKLIQS